MAARRRASPERPPKKFTASDLPTFLLHFFEEVGAIAASYGADAKCFGGAASAQQRVPLSVPEQHLPFELPLQIGFETRPGIDAMFQPIAQDRMRCLRVVTESLADLLGMVAAAIDHKVVLLLAIETINGMSKTAPMTAKALRKVQESSPEGS